MVYIVSLIACPVINSDEFVLDIIRYTHEPPHGVTEIVAEIEHIIGNCFYLNNSEVDGGVGIDLRVDGSAYYHFKRKKLSGFRYRLEFKPIVHKEKETHNWMVEGF